MNFNVTFMEDALTVAWKSTGSVAICKSTKTAGGMCASIRPDALQTKQELCLH